MATAEQYAQWLVDNQDKKGTPDFETVKKAYLEVRPSTASEKIEGAGRGVNVGLADVLGSPVDAINQLPRLLNLLPGEQGFGPITENPVGGSQSIRNAMTNLFDLGYQDIQDLPKDQRPFAQGGEVFGQTVGTILPVFGAARNVSALDATVKAAPKSNIVSQTVDDIVKTTAANPGTTAAVETGLALAPSVGAGFAEQARPGDPTTRMYGELAGAFSPVVLSTVLPTLTANITRALGTLTPSGRERQAAKLVQTDQLERGADLTAEAKKLREAKGSGTAGQVTGNQGFLAIENELVKSGGQISEDIAKQTQLAISEFNDAYRAAITSGDPELVRLAAQARQDYLVQSLDERVKTAAKRAQDLQATNMPNVDRAQINKQARDIVESALVTARKTENQLWSGVKRDLTVRADNTLEAFNDVKASLASGEELPAPLKAVIKDIKKDQKKKKLGKGETTTGNLLRTRSRYLELAREARAQSKFGDARMYSQVADAMLKDLDPVTGDIAKTAREFSRELNKKFTQGFVGKTLGFDRDGGITVDPTRTLDVARSGQDQQTLLNLQALRNAAGDQSGDMMQLQQRFLQSFASDATNYDGSVNPQKLDNFIRSNAQTIQDLGLTDTFTSTEQAARLAERVADQALQGTKFARTKSTTAKVLGTNNVNEFINRVLRSGDVAGGIKDVSRLAKKSGDPSVLDGLRYGVYETLLDNATTSSGMISGTRLDQLLNAKTGNQTVRQTLMVNGLFNSQQMKNVDRLIAKTKEFESALANTDQFENLLGKEDIFFDLLLRIGGANLGGSSALGQAAGTPLVLAGAGVRTAKNAFEKMPKLRVKTILAEAIKDPKLMADLLERPTTAKLKAARNKRLNAVLVQAGIFDGSELLEEEFE
tara:strand:- start:574 stop:3219 length:2646 start_codon:yes stop_codon:yes gene_type:complete